MHPSLDLLKAVIEVINQSIWLFNEQRSLVKEIAILAEQVESDGIASFLEDLANLCKFLHQWRVLVQTLNALEDIHFFNIIEQEICDLSRMWLAINNFHA